MRLFGIERHPDNDGVALRSYECPHCHSLQTDDPTWQPAAVANGSSKPLPEDLLKEHLLDESGFDDAALKLLARAFDTAWAIVGNSSRIRDQAPQALRERLAKCVIAQGIAGERSVTRIVDGALSFLWQQRARR